MSVQLKELLEKIRQEGVREAEREAEQIRTAAEEEAKGILESARREAESELEKRRAEAGRLEAAGREAVRQAGRDLVLSVRGELTKLFERILKEEVGAALDHGTLADAIVSVLDAWGKSSTAEALIEVPEEALDTVRKTVIGRLQKKIAEGAEIQPSPRIKRGFRVSEKEGSAYLDFTDEGISEFLMEYLNPRVAELLKGQPT